MHWGRFAIHRRTPKLCNGDSYSWQVDYWICFWRFWKTWISCGLLRDKNQKTLVYRFLVVRCTANVLEKQASKSWCLFFWRHLDCDSWQKIDIGFEIKKNIKVCWGLEGVLGRLVGNLLPATWHQVEESYGRERQEAPKRGVLASCWEFLGRFGKHFGNTLCKKLTSNRLKKL